MPNPSLAINKCSWLFQGSTERCNKNSIGKFCGYHNSIAKQGRPDGPHPCIKCGIGIRANAVICVQCGSNKYRSICAYSKRRQRPIPTPEEFIKWYHDNPNSSWTSPPGQDKIH